MPYYRYCLIALILIQINLKVFAFDFNDFLNNISNYEDLSLKTTSTIDISDIVEVNKKKEDNLDIVFSQERWNEFIKRKERGEIEEEKKEVSLERNIEISTQVLPQKPQVEFVDLGTSLNVTGRKLISVNYSGKRYLNEQTNISRERSYSNFDITQQFQVRMQGKVGEKITVNVDYDDTKKDKQDISLTYQGDPQEVVQNVSFGDIDMSLPSTEFVSYNKQLFGIRADLKSGGFKGTIIGSRTKGQSKTRQFKGNSQFQTIDIPDSSYIRRRYYDITFGNKNFLPIKPGSEKIYIDYQTSQPIDNIIITSMTANDIEITTVTYTGRFKLLTRGVDYTIDYNRGEVIFSRTLEPQSVVIIDYQKSDGNYLSADGMYKILKSLNDIYISSPDERGWRNEIKTYYFIGQSGIVRDDGHGNFILKVQNLNRQEVGSNLNPPQKYPDTIEVDFEQGIIKLLRPFGSENDPNIPDPQIYSPSPITKRIIHVEYYYKIKTFYLEPDIVPNSEIIKVDGKKLNKNQDYYIDYDAGFLTLYDPDSIGQNSIVDVYYEVSPFGGGDQMLVGTRLSYDFSNHLSLGTTLIYQGSNKSRKAPQVSELSSNLFVADANTDIKDINVFGIKTSLSFEIARSILNPNTNDNAVIENMENVKQEDSASLDKNLWYIASNPSGIPSHADAINWNSEEVYKRDINPNTPDDTKQQILNIDYDFSISSEVSIVYVFSKTGLDFSKKNMIGLTIKGDNPLNGPFLSLHLGDVDEDSDGSGGMTLICQGGKIIYNAPKTEDLNCDGILSPNEDKGWLYSPPGGLGTRRFGQDNGRIDSQDLDGNGRLDIQSFIGGDFGKTYQRFWNNFIDISSNNIETSEVNFNSWHNWIFPLVIPSTESYKWSNIKVVRLTLSKNPNAPTKGRLSIANLSITGTTWNIELSSSTNETLKIYAVNNIDNPNYIPLFNAGGIVSSAYNDLYGSVTSQKQESGAKNILEQALAIEFNNWTSSSTSYAYRKFSVPLNISQHEEFKFFVYNSTQDFNARFYLILGDRTNYFKVSIPLNFSGWKLFTIKQTDLNNDGIADVWESFEHGVIISTSGNFSLQNIPQLIVGLDVLDNNPHNAAIYLNDIYLSKPIKRYGNARKAQGSFDIPGFMSFGAKHKSIDRMFQTPVSAITNQDVEENSGYLTLYKPSFFPTSYTYSKRITNTPNIYNTGNNNLLNLLQQGRVKTEDLQSRGSFNPGLIPKIDLTYTRNITEYESISRTDEKHNYSAATNFSPRIEFFLIPKDISILYNYTINKINYSFINNIPQNYYNSDERTTYYYGKTMFDIFRFISITPSYSISKTYEKRITKEDSFSYPKSLNQTVGFNSSIRFFRWFSPNINYSITTNENNNINITTITVGQISKTYNIGEIKAINRNAQGNIGFTLSMAELFPKTSGLRTMVITSNYQIQDGDVWNYVEKNFDSKKYLWIRSPLKPSSILSQRQSATMRDNYNINIRIQPFEGWNLSQKLNPLSTLSVASNFIYSAQKSYSYDVLTKTTNKTIPDAIITISQLENMLGINKWANSLTMNIRYSRNINIVEKNSREDTNNTGIELRFFLLNFMNTSFTYNNQNNKKEDLRLNQMIQKSNRNSASLQGSFDIKTYRFTPRIDYSKDYAQGTLGTVVTNTTIFNPSLIIRRDVKIPKSVKLPFFGESILDNRIIWTTNINYQIKKSPISVQDNNRLFSLTSNADVEASKNLRLGLNASLQRYWHKYLKQEEYISYQIGMNIVFQF